MRQLLGLVCCLLLVTTLLSPTLVRAQSDELEGQLRAKQDEIRKLEAQLEEAQKQEKSLTSQLKIIDTNISITQAKIDEANFQITKLEKEIGNLDTSIDRVSKNVDKISEILLKRIVTNYKYNQVSGLDLLFSSNGFADMLERIKYIQVAQIYDKKKLYELQATKSLYNDQKTDKETRQNQKEVELARAEKLEKDLDAQKKSKEDLLRATQNDEARFQKLIAQLRADLESISRALGSKGVKLGTVSKGERIASVGNSGCSTGPHLHFEVISPAKVENGMIVNDSGDPVGWNLSARKDPLPYIQSGQFAKPTANYTGRDCSGAGVSCNIGDITTRFGQVYFLGTHTGLDIADYSGVAIYAADNGEAYAIQDTKACAMTGTVGKGVFVDHKNGMVTLYWHIP